jgi:hypothetical protein
MHNIIEEARHFLDKSPPAISGKGGDRHTFFVALTLTRKFKLSEDNAFAIIQEWNQRCIPPWSSSELLHKLRSATNINLLSKPKYFKTGGTRFNGQNTRNQNQAKPTFRPMVLKRIAAKTAKILNVKSFLKKLSPVSIDEMGSVDVLRLLYPAGTNEKILIFSIMQSQGQILWSTERFIPECNLPSGCDGVWFLPQPVTGEYYPNPRLDGKKSRRSQEAVTAWRYAIVESDSASSDDWLRCLIQFPLRISSICESGGRSIHALIRIDAESKNDWEAKISAVKAALTTLGADSHALTAIRLTRLPQAMRGDCKQNLLYLNPNPTGASIFSWTSPLKGSL